MIFVENYAIQADGKAVYQLCDNTKAALREIADKKKITIDASWSSRQLGANVIKALGDSNPAVSGDYLIVKNSDGSVKAFKKCKDEKTVLRGLADKIGCAYVDMDSAETLASKIAAFMANGWKNPVVNSTDERQNDKRAKKAHKDGEKKSKRGCFFLIGGIFKFLWKCLTCFRYNYDKRMHYSEDGTKLLSADKDIKKCVIREGSLEVCDKAFEDCKALKKVKIAKSIKKIGDYAFNGCKSLEKIEIPSTVTSIGVRAFAYCESLQKFKIPKSVTSIGGGVFLGCELKKLSLKSKAFSKDKFCLFDAKKQVLISCYKKPAVDYKIPSSVKSVDEFSGIKLEPVNKPISKKASSGSSNESKTDKSKEAEKPKKEDNKLKYDKDGKVLYYADPKIKSCVIREGTLCIEDGTFEGREGLKSVIIPETITRIGDCAFRGCISIEKIMIPKSVAEIGKMAFARCSLLKSINIPESVKEIGDGVFYECDIDKLTLDSKYFSTDGICLFDSEKKRLISCYKSNITNYTIPNTVTTIGSYAFCGCYGLKSIKIPNSVTEIKGSAFLHCESLESIDIPNSVTFIGGWAFSYCNSLESVKIPESVTGLGDNLFESCDLLGNVTIPSSLEDIPNYMFYGCKSLRTLIIPKPINWIGESAFVNCLSLKEITFPATITEIADGDWVFAGSPALEKIYIPKGTKEKFKKLLPDREDRLTEI